MQNLHKEIYHNTTQDERWKIEEGSNLSIDTTECISDRLHRTALLVRKSRYNINNSQGDIIDYAS